MSKRKYNYWYSRRGGFIPRPYGLPSTPGRVPYTPISPPRSPGYRRPNPYNLPGFRTNPGTGRPYETGRPRSTEPATRPEGNPKASPRTRTRTQPKPVNPLMPRYPRVTFGPRGHYNNPRGSGINSRSVRPTHTGSTYSYVDVKVPERIRMKSWPRGFQSITIPQSAYSNLSYRIETSLGQQNAYTYTYTTASNLDAWIKTITGYNNTTQLLLQRVEVIYTMTNNTNTNMFLELWDGYYRRNSSNNASTLFVNGMIDEGGTSTTASQWGMDPLKSLAFRTICKVKAVRRVELGPGRSHIHKVKTKYGSRWSEEYYNSSTTSYLDGWTRFTMFIVRGSPVNDVTTTTNVSTAAVALDVVASNKATFTFISPVTQTITVSSNLPTITPANAEVVNPSTGVGGIDTKY